MEYLGNHIVEFILGAIVLFGAGLVALNKLGVISFKTVSCPDLRNKPFAECQNAMLKLLGPTDSKIEKLQVDTIQIKNDVKWIVSELKRTNSR